MTAINEQGSLPLRKPLAINGDQFQQTADMIRQRIAYLRREAEIYEQLAIEAWMKAEIAKSKQST
jgi:hypothetical protein